MGFYLCTISSLLPLPFYFIFNVKWSRNRYHFRRICMSSVREPHLRCAVPAFFMLLNCNNRKLENSTWVYYSGGPGLSSSFQVKVKFSIVTITLSTIPSSSGVSFTVFPMFPFIVRVNTECCGMLPQFELSEWKSQLHGLVKNFVVLLIQSQCSTATFWCVYLVYKNWTQGPFIRFLCLPSPLHSGISSFDFPPQVSGQYST